MNGELIICGSSRKKGRSAYLIKELKAQQENLRDAPVFSLAEHKVGPCLACDACKKDYHCIVQDDMQELYSLLNEAQAVTVVSPVYFAGPPAQMKALLDRLQAYYWDQVDNGVGLKREAKLYVIGGGGDPHGFEPLVISARSALAVAGFRLTTVYNCIAFTDEQLNEAAQNPYPFISHTFPATGMREDI